MCGILVSELFSPHPKLKDEISNCVKINRKGEPLAYGTLLAHWKLEQRKYLCTYWALSSPVLQPSGVLQGLADPTCHCSVPCGVASCVCTHKLCLSPVSGQRSSRHSLSSRRRDRARPAMAQAQVGPWEGMVVSPARPRPCGNLLPSKRG